MNLHKLDTFHKTRTGFVVFGLVELALAYLFGSLAINSGSLWEWTLTALLLLGVAQNFGRLMWRLAIGRRRKDLAGSR